MQKQAVSAFIMPFWQERNLYERNYIKSNYFKNRRYDSNSRTIEFTYESKD